MNSGDSVKKQSPYLSTLATHSPSKRRVQSATMIANSSVSQVKRLAADVKRSDSDSKKKSQKEKQPAEPVKSKSKRQRASIESLLNGICVIPHPEPATATQSPSKEGQQQSKKKLSGGKLTPRPSTTKGSLQRSNKKSMSKQNIAIIDKADVITGLPPQSQRSVLETLVKPILKAPSAERYGKSSKGKSSSISQSQGLFTKQKKRTAVLIPDNELEKDTRKVSFFEKVLIHPVPYESRGSTEWQHNLMMARESLLQNFMSNSHISFLGGGLINTSNSATGLFERGAGSYNSRYGRNYY